MKDRTFLPVQIDDLEQFRYLSDVRIAPDCSAVGLIVKKINIGRNSYLSDVYLLHQFKGKGTLQNCTSCGQVFAYTWAPDSGSILCLIPSEKSDGGMDLVRFDAQASGPHRLAELPFKAWNLAAIDARTILFTARVPVDPECEVKDGSRAVVLKDIPFWLNEEGFTSGYRTHLFVMDLKSGEIRRLLNATRSVLAYDVHGQHVAVVSLGDRGSREITDVLSLVDLTSGDQEILSQGVFAMTRPAEVCFLSDQEIAFLGTDMGRYGFRQSRELIVYDRSRHVVRSWTPDWDRMVGNVINSDCRHGAGPVLAASDGRLFVVTTEGFNSYLVAVERDGTLTRVIDREGSIGAFDVNKDAVFYVAMREGKLQELYENKRGEEICRSDFNGLAFADRWTGIPERFAVTSDDGAMLDAWIIRPFGFDASRKYPGILSVHGGPKTAYGAVFVHEMQVLAGRGYVVIFANPRGSAGRGDAFADLGLRYGEVDREDLISVIDDALCRFPFLDERRLGIMGGSYGGYLVNLMIGQTDRFCVACAQRSIANWISKFCTGDNGYFVNYERGTPWDAAESLWEHSPLRWADRARTPTLLIHAEEDRNCPLGEALQMFTALQYHGVPSRLVLFRGESHELSRSGLPRARIRRLKEIVDWFDRYLHKAD